MSTLRVIKHLDAIENIASGFWIKTVFDSCNPEATSREGMKGCAGVSDSSHYGRNTNEENKNVVTNDISPTTPGQMLLFRMATVGDYIESIKKSVPEHAQLLLLGIQELMEPAKAAVGFAGNALIGASLGDQNTAAKDKISLELAAGLTGKDAGRIDASGKVISNLHNQEHLKQEGDR